MDTSYPYDIAKSMADKIYYKFQNKKVKVKIDTSNYGSEIEMGNGPCVVLVIRPNDPMVYLSKINAGKKCTREGPATGTFLLQLAMEFSEKILDAQGLTLYDDAHFYCYDNELDLSLYSFMIYGDTWYARYGFLPFERTERARYLRDQRKYRQARITDLPQKLQKELSYDTNNVMEAMQNYRCLRTDNRNGNENKFKDVALDILKALKIQVPELGDTFGYGYGLWVLNF